MTNVGWIFRKHWHPDRQRLARLRAALLILRGWETEICGRCGRGVGQVWHAPDELWLAGNGTGVDSGVLCVRCFDTLACRAGLRPFWEVAAHGVWPSCNGNPCPHEETMRICCNHRDEYWDKLVAALGEDDARRIVA